MVIRRILLVLLTALLAAACTGPATPAAGGSPPEGQAPAPTEAPAPAAVVPTGVPAQPTSAATEAPFVVPEDFVPTDPQAVNLAAGRPQFVEFFAFW